MWTSCVHDLIARQPLRFGGFSDVRTAMLTIVLRVLGVTLLDMAINTDGEAEQDCRPDLDGRSVGFEVRTDTTNLPSLEDD